MTQTRKEVRAELLSKMAKCTRISVNGVSYFGELTVKEDGTRIIENAVPESSSIENTIRNWVKAANLNNFQSLKISGDATYVEQGLTEDQEQEAELVIIAASRAAANAIPELINSKF